MSSVGSSSNFEYKLFGKDQYHQTLKQIVRSPPVKINQILNRLIKEGVPLEENHLIEQRVFNFIQLGEKNHWLESDSDVFLIQQICQRILPSPIQKSLEQLVKKMVRDQEKSEPFFSEEESKEEMNSQGESSQSSDEGFHQPYQLAVVKESTQDKDFLGLLRESITDPEEMDWILKEVFQSSRFTPLEKKLLIKQLANGLKQILFTEKTRNGQDGPITLRFKKDEFIQTDKLYFLIELALPLLKNMEGEGASTILSLIAEHLENQGFQHLLKAISFCVTDEEEKVNLFTSLSILLMNFKDKKDQHKLCHLIAQLLHAQLDFGRPNDLVNQLTGSLTTYSIDHVNAQMKRWLSLSKLERIKLLNHLYPYFSDILGAQAIAIQITHLDLSPTNLSSLVELLKIALENSPDQQRLATAQEILLAEKLSRLHLPSDNPKKTLAFERLQKFFMAPAETMEVVNTLLYMPNPSSVAAGHVNREITTTLEQWNQYIDYIIHMLNTLAPSEYLHAIDLITSSLQQASFNDRLALMKQMVLILHTVAREEGGVSLEEGNKAIQSSKPFNLLANLVSFFNQMPTIQQKWVMVLAIGELLDEKISATEITKRLKNWMASDAQLIAHLLPLVTQPASVKLILKLMGASDEKLEEIQKELRQFFQKLPGNLSIARRMELVQLYMEYNKKPLIRAPLMSLLACVDDATPILPIKEALENLPDEKTMELKIQLFGLLEPIFKKDSKDYEAIIQAFDWIPPEEWQTACQSLSSIPHNQTSVVLEYMASLFKGEYGDNQIKLLHLIGKPQIIVQLLQAKKDAESWQAFIIATLHVLSFKEDQSKIEALLLLYPLIQPHLPKEPEKQAALIKALADAAKEFEELKQYLQKTKSLSLPLQLDSVVSQAEIKEVFKDLPADAECMKDYKKTLELIPAKQRIQSARALAELLTSFSSPERQECFEILKSFIENDRFDLINQMKQLSQKNPAHALMIIKNLLPIKLKQWREVLHLIEKVNFDQVEAIEKELVAILSKTRNGKVAEAVIAAFTQLSAYSSAEQLLNLLQHYSQLPSDKRTVIVTTLKPLFEKNEEIEKLVIQLSALSASDSWKAFFKELIDHLANSPAQNRLAVAELFIQSTNSSQLVKATKESSKEDLGFSEVLKQVENINLPISEAEKLKALTALLKIYSQAEVRQMLEGFNPSLTTFDTLKDQLKGDAETLTAVMLCHYYQLGEYEEALAEILAIMPLEDRFETLPIWARALKSWLSSDAVKHDSLFFIRLFQAMKKADKNERKRVLEHVTQLTKNCTDFKKINEVIALLIKYVNSDNRENFNLTVLPLIAAIPDCATIASVMNRVGTMNRLIWDVLQQVPALRQGILGDAVQEKRLNLLASFLQKISNQEMKEKFVASLIIIFNESNESKEMEELLNKLNNISIEDLSQLVEGLQSHVEDPYLATLLMLKSLSHRYQQALEAFIELKKEGSKYLDFTNFLAIYKMYPGGNSTIAFIRRAIMKELFTLPIPVQKNVLLLIDKCYVESINEEDDCEAIIQLIIECKTQPEQFSTKLVSLSARLPQTMIPYLRKKFGLSFALQIVMDLSVIEVASQNQGRFFNECVTILNNIRHPQSDYPLVLRLLKIIKDDVLKESRQFIDEWFSEPFFLNLLINLPDSDVKSMLIAFKTISMWPPHMEVEQVVDLQNAFVATLKQLSPVEKTSYLHYLELTTQSLRFLRAFTQIEGAHVLLQTSLSEAAFTEFMKVKNLIPLSLSPEEQDAMVYQLLRLFKLVKEEDAPEIYGYLIDAIKDRRTEADILLFLNTWNQLDRNKKEAAQAALHSLGINKPNETKLLSFKLTSILAAGYEQEVFELIKKVRYYAHNISAEFLLNNLRDLKSKEQFDQLSSLIEQNAYVFIDFWPSILSMSPLFEQRLMFLKEAFELNSISPGLSVAGKLGVMQTKKREAKSLFYRGMENYFNDASLRLHLSEHVYPLFKGDVANFRYAMQKWIEDFANVLDLIPNVAEQQRAAPDLISLFNTLEDNERQKIINFLLLFIGEQVGQTSAIVSVIEACAAMSARGEIKKVFDYSMSWQKISDKQKAVVISSLQEVFSQPHIMYEMAFLLTKNVDGADLEEISKSFIACFKTANVPLEQAKSVLDYVLVTQKTDKGWKSLNLHDIDFINLFNQMCQELPEDEIDSILEALSKVASGDVKDLIKDVLALRNDPDSAVQCLALLKSLNKLSTPQRVDLKEFIKRLNIKEGYQLISIVEGLCAVPSNDNGYLFRKVLTNLKYISGLEWKHTQVVISILNVLKNHTNTPVFYEAIFNYIIKEDMIKRAKEAEAWNSLSASQQAYASNAMRVLFDDEVLVEVLLQMAHKPKSTEAWQEFVDDFCAILLETQLRSYPFWASMFKGTDKEQRAAILQVIGKPAQQYLEKLAPMYQEIADGNERLKVLKGAAEVSAQLVKLPKKLPDYFFKSQFNCLMEISDATMRAHYLSQLALILPMLSQPQFSPMLEHFSIATSLIPIHQRADALQTLLNVFQKIAHIEAADIFLDTVSDALPQQRMEIVQAVASGNEQPFMVLQSRMLSDLLRLFPVQKEVRAAVLAKMDAAYANARNIEEVFNSQTLQLKSNQYVKAKIKTKCPEHPAGDYRFAKFVHAYYGLMKFPLLSQQSILENAIVLEGASKPETRKDPQNIYTLFENLRGISHESLDDIIKLQRLNLEGKDGFVELQASKLKKYASKKHLSYKDLPPDYQTQSFENLLRSFETRLTFLPMHERQRAQNEVWEKFFNTANQQTAIAQALDLESRLKYATAEEKAQAQQQTIKQITDDFASTRIEALVPVLKSGYLTDLVKEKGEAGDRIDNSKLYVHRILEMIYQQSNQPEGAKILTPREEMLLSLAWQLRVCSTGQKDGLNLCYMTLVRSSSVPQHAREEDEAVEQCIEKLDMQLLLVEVFSKETFLRDVAGRPKPRSLPQESHQTDYLLNRAARHLGVNHNLSFDNYAGVIIKELIEVPTATVVNKVLDHLPINEMIKKIKTAVNESYQMASEEAKNKYSKRDGNQDMPPAQLAAKLEVEAEKGKMKFYNQLKDYLSVHLSKEEQDYDPHWDKKYLKLSIKYEEGLLVENKFLGELTDEGALALLQSVGIIDSWKIN
jgi:hypothetical protein